MSSNRSSFDFSGARVLVTGGTSGIGSGIASAYRAAGARVTITGTRPSAADYDEDLSGYTYLQLDVESMAQVDAVAHAQTEIDILVNNAGIEAGGMAGSEGFAESWRRVMDVNLDGTMRAVDALLPDLRAGGGSIVNVASIQSFIAYQAGTSAYATSKAALAQYTRSLAVDLAADGIRVNAIAPGFIETAMTAGTRADPTRLAAFRARTPLKRMGQPMELAGPVVFLVSRLSSYVTGTVLPVDGGMLAQ